MQLFISEDDVDLGGLVLSDVVDQAEGGDVQQVEGPRGFTFLEGDDPALQHGGVEQRRIRAPSREHG